MYLRKFTFFLAVLVCCCKSVIAEQAETDPARYVFSASRVSIPRQIKDLKLFDVRSVPDGHDVMARFSNPKMGVYISLCVYASPPETTGPFLMLDSSGKEMLEDRQDEIKRFSAVFKLTTPSDSYIQEYARVIKVITSADSLTDAKVDKEFRFRAVPTRKDSPVAYAAYISAMQQSSDGESMALTWKTYLYAIPGYFVKIHFTYPSQLWLDVGGVKFHL